MDEVDDVDQMAGGSTESLSSLSSTGPDSMKIPALPPN